MYYNYKIKQLKSYSVNLSEQEMAMRHLIKIDDVDAFRKMGDGEKSDYVKSLGIDIEQPKKKVVVSPVVVKEIKPIETEVIENQRGFNIISNTKEEDKQETLTYSESSKKEERIFNSNIVIKEKLEVEQTEEIEMDAELQDLTNQYFEKLGKYPPKAKAQNKKWIQEILTQNI